ncbi:hypothetical protein P389DRAFT_107309 [Cystobasidium minutum MCA 4210]|uniref:uncharacterized protein n=1 Tax=Cystobasidium minutum MCA 4210 TaxID=1397322 RepID=UPI0034CEDE3B|eukprot:jgi/Rhomi1/107309/CE107308_679
MEDALSALSEAAAAAMPAVESPHPEDHHAAAAGDVLPTPTEGDAPEDKSSAPGLGSQGEFAGAATAGSAVEREDSSSSNHDMTSRRASPSHRPSSATPLHSHSQQEAAGSTAATVLPAVATSDLQASTSNTSGSSTEHNMHEEQHTNGIDKNIAHRSVSSGPHHAGSTSSTTNGAPASSKKARSPDQDNFNDSSSNGNGKLSLKMHTSMSLGSQVHARGNSSLRFLVASSASSACPGPFSIGPFIFARRQASWRGRGIA